MKSAVNRPSIPPLKLLGKILYIKLAYFFNVFLLKIGLSILKGLLFLDYL